MCGISAIWNWAGEVPSRHLRAMADAQAHRGPDGRGYAVWQRHEHRDQLHAWRGRPDDVPALPSGSFRVGLAHNLLAIQDPTAAALQPMTLEEGRFWISYNGEIYNFQEIGAELAADGVRLRTRTDTEILLALWARMGSAALTRLRGMFAFALYDVADDTLWIARDRFGIKPVYYALLPDAQGVVVASEIRGIHASGLLARRWNEDVVRSFLAAGVNKPGDSETFFDGVAELPPGHVLRIRPGEVSVRQYYSLPDVGSCTITENELPEIRRAFRETIDLHLLSAREVGVCLSGGLDSSNIARAAAERLRESGAALQAFTIGAPGSIDMTLAGLAANGLDLNHHTLPSPAVVGLADLVEMTVACEMPNHFWGPINQFLLLRHIGRDHGISVLLNGQGGDESLSGYPWFVPPVERFIRARFGDANGGGLSTSYAKREPMPAAELRMAQRMYTSRRMWINVFDGGACAALGVSAEEVERWEPVRYYLNDELDWAGMRRQQLCRRELPHLLRQEDRLAMWFSIESRVPFVDHELVELFGAADPRFLFKDGYAKYPLRVLFPELPDAVRSETRKSGYWENHSRMPPFATMTAPAVESCDILTAMVPNPDKLEMLTPLASWRFLQIAALAAGSSASEARAWAADLSAPRDASSVSVL